MKNKILGMFLVLGMFMVFAAPTHASTLDDVMKQVKDLSSKVVTMQAQMSALALSSVPSTADKVSVDSTSVALVEKIKFSEKVAKVGDSSLDVENAQIVLVKNGYLFNEISGYFDKGTQTALLNFQKVQGLKQTGEIDDSTKSMLSLYSLNLSPYEIYASKEIMNYMLKNKVKLSDGQSFYRTTTKGLLKPSLDITVREVEISKAKGKPGNCDVRFRYVGRFGDYYTMYAVDHYGGVNPKWVEKVRFQIDRDGRLSLN